MILMGVFSKAEEEVRSIAAIHRIAANVDVMIQYMVAIVIPTAAWMPVLHRGPRLLLRRRLRHHQILRHLHHRLNYLAYAVGAQLAAQDTAGFALILHVQIIREFLWEAGFATIHTVAILVKVRP